MAFAGTHLAVIRNVPPAHPSKFRPYSDRLGYAAFQGRIASHIFRDFEPDWEKSAKSIMKRRAERELEPPVNLLTDHADTATDEEINI